MLTQKFTRLCKRLEWDIFDYLHTHHTHQPTRSCFDIPSPSLEEFPLLPSLEEQVVSAKPKKQQALSRICFKDMMFNDVSVSKYSISLSVSRKRQPEAQLSFTLEGQKHKLAIPPSKDNLSVTITLATNVMIIRSKTAHHLQYTTQSDKPRWNLKYSHADLTVQLHYHPKKYAQDALQHYFRLNNIHYAITDATPASKLANSQVNDRKEIEVVEYRSYYPPLDFPMPLDPDTDRPVRQLLAHLDGHQPRIVQSHRLHVANQQGMQPYQLSRSASAIYDNLENQQLTKPEGNDQALAAHENEEMKVQQEQHYEEGCNLQCNFRLPDEDELIQTFQVKMDIINLQMKEKKHIISSVFNIRKFHREDHSIQGNKIQCPITSCHLILTKVDELRAHFYIKHKQLSRYGIKVDSQGRLAYSQKSVNFVLYLARIYPNQVKKVIKRMKQKV